MGTGQGRTDGLKRTGRRDSGDGAGRGGETETNAAITASDKEKCKGMTFQLGIPSI